MSRTIHTKSEFVTDLRYARQMLRDIETALREGNWEQIEEAAEETSGVMASLASLARDNSKGVHDYDTIWHADYVRMRELGITRVCDLPKIITGGITEVAS